MKYISSITKKVYELTETRKRALTCPECNSDRKKQNKKDCHYYPETDTYYCFHCEATFYLYNFKEEKKDYIIPKWKNETSLSDKAVKYFTGRMISQKTLNKMKVYSSFENMPQFKKSVDVICFPYFIDNKLINIKYRGPNKTFKLNSGSELIFYNFDALERNKEIIICEGEIDALTWIENGYDNVLSVPNGAGNNLQYLDSSINLFDNIEKIYLSTDVDTKGIELRDELLRRLGHHKCYIVNFKQYKDANDYFVNYGGLEFKKLINNAKQIPVKGIVKIDSFIDDIRDLYENGEKPGLPINDNYIDEYITWELGRLCTVTGVPGSGKSEFVDYLVSRLNLLYGWKAAYFTPENYPLKYHYRKLHSKYSGKKFDKNDDTTDFYSIYENLKDQYFYILDENDMNVKTVINNALLLIKQKGIKILVIDPYNKLEHQTNRNETETQYISRFLDILVNLARFNNVLIFLVAHPRKMPKGETPSLYDISGSANFYNKTDYGITVDRLRDENTGAMINTVEIHIQKVKFKHLGKQGVITMNYNFNNGRFDGIEWDNSNWLEQKNNPDQTDFDFSDVTDIDF
jgi:twinkle protein